MRVPRSRWGGPAGRYTSDSRARPSSDYDVSVTDAAIGYALAAAFGTGARFFLMSMIETGAGSNPRARVFAEIAERLVTALLWPAFPYPVAGGRPGRDAGPELPGPTVVVPVPDWVRTDPDRGYSRGTPYPPGEPIFPVTAHTTDPGWLPSVEGIPGR